MVVMKFNDIQMISVRIKFYICGGDLRVSILHPLKEPAHFRIHSEKTNDKHFDDFFLLFYCLCGLKGYLHAAWPLLDNSSRAFNILDLAS